MTFKKLAILSSFCIATLLSGCQAQEVADKPISSASEPSNSFTGDSANSGETSEVKSESDTSVSNSEPSSEAVEPAPEDISSANEGSQSSDNWITVYPTGAQAGYFSLEGVTYRSTDTVGKLLENGWQWSEQAVAQEMNTKKISAMVTMRGVGTMLTKGNANLTFDCLNLTDTEKPYSECTLYGIHISVQAADNREFEVTDGISLYKSSREEIISAMIARGLANIEDSELMLKFEDEEGSTYSFNMYKSAYSDNPEVATHFDVNFKMTY